MVLDLHENGLGQGHIGIGGILWCHKLRSEVGFHVEGNSSSFAGRTVLEEKNVTWEAYFVVFEFVM